MLELDDRILIPQYVGTMQDIATPYGSLAPAIPDNALPGGMPGGLFGPGITYRLSSMRPMPALPGAALSL